MKASLIPTVTHDRFDGTTFPVQNVPDWSSLTTAEYNLPYSSIPSSKMVSLPRYNPSDFETSFSSLKWGDSSTKNLRNAKITYSVPYMGDYSLDSTEYKGSHLAVDIKIPTGTPVFAIANGIVLKASRQSTGFGNHIVLEHDNFPSIDDKDNFTTYYSSYSHLSSVLVEQGSVVHKGDQIGLSGESGTATTPHLHFQIDNDNADWHPYWPFTWQEANNAGVDFFDAINIGLGKDSAIMTTINPLVYVQKYLDASGINPPTTETPVVETPVVETQDDSNNDVAVNADPVVSDPVTDPVSDVENSTVNPSNLSFKIGEMSAYEEGSSVYVNINILDENEDVFTGSFDGIVNLSLTENVGTLEKDRVSYSDFQDGGVKIKITNLTPGRASLKVTYGEDAYYSSEFDVKIAEKDTNISAATSFDDVPLSHENYTAIKYLVSNGVINGYNDGTFKPEAVVTRSEAVKLILEGIDAPIEVSYLPFKDLPTDDWSYKYVSTAYTKSVVSGYPDGQFKGGNTVNRAEFLKILLTAMDINLSKNVSKSPYKDVSKNDWFAPDFKYAKDHNLIDSNLRAWPSQGMTRAEVAEIMYRVMTNEL